MVVGKLNDRVTQSYLIFKRIILAAVLKTDDMV